MSDASQSTAQGRLVGWKRIATHLRCSERTARRWEAQEALPIHRHVHDSKSTVFAFEGELDSWIATRAAVSPPGQGAAQAQADAVAPLAAHRARSRLPLLLGAGLLSLVVLVAAFIAVREAPEETAAALSPDPVANDLYRRGQALWEQRGVEASARAIKMLSAAVERDGDFAAAWSALALAWATYSTYAVEVENARAMDEAVVAANRALELDPSLVEARSLMAFFAQRKGDWAESQRIYEQALALDPDNANLLLWYATHYRELGMFERAKALTTQARAISPTSPAVLTEIAMNHLQAHETDEGAALITYVREDLGVDTPILWFGSGMVALRREDPDALHRWAQGAPFPEVSPLLVDFIAARKGGPEAVEAMAIRLDQAHAREALPGWAAFYLLLQLEQPARALDVAEREVDAREFINAAVFYDLRTPAVRESPRFTALVEGQGMFAYWREVGAPDFCREQVSAPVCVAIAEGAAP